ncbi:MAG: diaminopimelate epimerase [Magnetococcales bacterium]|nr:diaminopimelate epimerase [Magnetococcales bacterium]
MSEQRTVAMLKCHGASNDFIILDECDAVLIPDALKAAFARLVSDRRGGIGADGVIFVSRFDARHPRMRFFNPDGSEAEMSGNGIRCASRACFEGGYAGQDPLVFKTPGGFFKTENFFSDTHQLPFVRLSTDAVSTNPENILASRSSAPFINQPFHVHGQQWMGTLLAIGNPHLVVPVLDLHALDLMTLGAAMEHHPMFLNRANVSFVQVVDRRTLLVQTHERGVGLTLSCGTGMTASVLAQLLNGTVDNHVPVEVHSAGGIVWVTPQVNGERVAAQLTGNATWLYRGKLFLEIDAEEIRFASPQRLEREMDYEEEGARFAQLAKQSRFDRTILKGTSLEPLLQAGLHA